MKPLDLALTYMDIFFDDCDTGALSVLLAENFTFTGPLYQFDNAATFLETLRSNPPEGFGFELIQTFENGNDVCLLFEFTKPGVSTPMAQVFHISANKISQIRLIFDTGALQVI